MPTEEEVKEWLADYVTVTLKIPKEVAEWFKDTYTTTLEERLTAEIVEVCYAQIENIEPQVVIDKYHLGPVFKQYDLIK